MRSLTKSQIPGPLSYQPAFPFTAFRSFDHHWKTNVLDCFLGLLHRTYSTLAENVLQFLGEAVFYMQS